jgi:hypothetical protein
LEHGNTFRIIPRNKVKDDIQAKREWSEEKTGASAIITSSRYTQNYELRSDIVFRRGEKSHSSFYVPSPRLQ